MPRRKGRRKKKAGTKLDARVLFYLTAADARRLDDLAYARNEPVAEVVRREVLRLLEREAGDA